VIVFAGVGFGEDPLVECFWSCFFPHNLFSWACAVSPSLDLPLVLLSAGSGTFFDQDFFLRSICRFVFSRRSA